MKTYVYFFRRDITQEPIGRIKADNEWEARELIKFRKQLSDKKFDKLFEIKEESNHENNI
jgi:hypothetical protein